MSVTHVKPRALRWRNCIVCAVVAACGAAAVAPAGAQTALPGGLDFVTTLEEARTRLLQLRNSGVISQDEMMTLSQQLEPRLRGHTMNDWRVADSRKSVTGVERGGSNPTAGRGIFSDEDLQTKSLQQYDDLLQKAKQGHYTIVEDSGYRFKIKELDTIVWKPTDATHDQILGDVTSRGRIKRVPAGTTIPGIDVAPDGTLPPNLAPEQRRNIIERFRQSSQALEVELDGEALTLQRPAKSESIAIRRDLAQRLAEDPEVAFASRPGVNPRPSDALEAALENTTKGGKALFADISKYSPEHAEMELLAAAKDVWRSMKASGMCDSDPGLCLSLDHVRRMKQPVSSLGFGNFAETQARLRDLQAKAFANAQSVFQNQLDLISRWRRDYPGDAYYARRTAELQSQLDRMAVRFEQLAKDHPQFAELVGQRARQFWRQQMDRSRALGATHTAAGVNPGLIILLDAAVFYQCVDEGKDPSTGLVSNATLTKCFALGAGGHLLGLVLERALPVVLSLPGVGIVATGVVGVAVGGAVVLTAIEATKAAIEIARYAAAWLEAYLNDSRLEEQQQKNAASFEARLAAEQKAIADALAPLQKTRGALETQLDMILRDQAQLGQSLRVGRVRLRSLMQQLKQRMAPGCDGLAGPDPLEKYATSAEQDETLVEQQLQAAESGAAACVSPTALGQATAAFTQATTALQRIETTFAAATTLRSSRATSRIQIQEQLPTLAQARTLWERLVAMLPEAERAREAYAPVPRAVWDLNDRIAVTVRDLTVRQEAFALAFPPALLDVPANRDRILRMKIDITSLRPIGEERVEALHKASVDVGVTLVNLIRGEAIDIERPLRELSECATRPSDAETIERIDTAKTLAQLAMAKLGAAYRRSAFVCQQRLAGNGTTAVDRGGSSFDPSMRARPTPPSPRDRTDPDGSRSTSADPANAAHRDDAEKDARTREANRRTRADEIRRLAEQTLNALAQSAAAVTPNGAAAVPPSSPPALAPPPAVKAQTEKAPTPTATAAKDPYLSSWSCTATRIFHDNTGTQTKTGSARWSIYATDSRGRSLYYVMVGEARGSWLELGPSHMFGQRRNDKLYIELWDGSSGLTDVFGSEEGKRPRYRRETYELERAGDKMLGTYQFAYTDGRTGSGEGTVACQLVPAKAASR